MMTRIARWLAVALAGVLLGCSGSDDRRPATLDRFLAALATSDPQAQRRHQLAASSSEAVEAAPDFRISVPWLLDWAELKFPGTFPRGPSDQFVDYAGVRYIVRAYANGNYLGVTAKGEVFGLGPFTQMRLTAYGATDDYAAQVAADWCSLYPASCANSSACPPSPRASPTLSLGGQVSGLPSGQELELSWSGRTHLVTADGPFCLPGQVAVGSTYDVAVSKHPTGVRCGVVNGRGSVDRLDIGDLVVACSSARHWSVNGTVSATSLSPDGRTLYLGGGFTKVLRPLGQLVPLHPTGGEPHGQFPALAGTVRVQVADGRGGWFVGGSDLWANSRSYGPLMRLMPDGTPDDSFIPFTAGTITTMALDGARLIISGGGFTDPRDSSFQLRTLHTQSRELGAFGQQFDSAVQQIRVQWSTIYVMGFFSSAAGQPRTRLAALGLATGALLPWNPNARDYYGGTSVRLTTLLATPARIYVAGDFHSIGGRQQRGLAALHPETAAFNWGADLSAEDRGVQLSPEVSTFLPDGDRVLIGGSFSAVGGVRRNGIAALAAADGTLLPWDPQLKGLYSDASAVMAMRRSGSSIYIAGGFASAGPKRLSNLARLDATTAVALPWVEQGASSVHRLELDVDRVWVSGNDAPMVGGVARSSLAAIDTRTGLPTDWNPTASSPYPSAQVVSMLQAVDDVVLVSGDFNRIGGADKANFAVLDAATGAARPGPAIGSFSPWPAARVNQAAVRNGRVYIAGTFRKVNEQPRVGLAAFTLSDGQLLPWAADHAGGESTSMGVTQDVVFVSLPSSPFIEARDAISGTRLPWRPDPVYLQSGPKIPPKLATDGGNRLLVLSPDTFYTARIFGLDTLTGNRLWGGDTFLSVTGVLTVSSGLAFLAAPPSQGIDDRVPARAYVTTLDLPSGRTFPTAGSYLGNVRSLSADPTQLWAGGDFTAVSTEPARGLWLSVR